MITLNDRQINYIRMGKDYLKNSDLHSFFVRLYMNNTDASALAQYMLENNVPIWEYLETVFPLFSHYQFSNTDLSLPSNIKRIASNAFACSNLTSVTMTDSVQMIEQSAFQSCSGLQSIRLSNQLTVIPAYCFDGCDSLQEIFIPDSVQLIERNAFYNTNAIVKISKNRSTKIELEKNNDMVLANLQII